MIKIIPFLLCIICLTGCSAPKTEFQGFSMDAPYHITGYGLSREQLDQAKEILNHADNRFSAYRDTSTLSILNHNKKLSVQTDDDKALYQIIDKTIPYCDDYFDISIRPVSKLWDFTSDAVVLPNAEKIAENLKYVDFRNIILYEDSVELKHNAELDLGAVAKGFVCDEIASYLKDEIALIDIGGTVKTVGQSVTAGVKSPTLDGLLCSFTLPAGKAVATSGSYERNITVNGKLYHHILNPKTGYPFESELVSVSVICDSAMVADIMATKLFAMGNTGLSEENLEAVFVTRDRKVYLTDGIKDFKMLHKDYTLVNEKGE